MSDSMGGLPEARAIIEQACAVYGEQGAENIFRNMFDAVAATEAQLGMRCPLAGIGMLIAEFDHQIPAPERPDVPEQFALPVIGESCGWSHLSMACDATKTADVIAHDIPPLITHEMTHLKMWQHNVRFGDADVTSPEGEFTADQFVGFIASEGVAIANEIETYGADYLGPIHYEKLVAVNEETAKQTLRDILAVGDEVVITNEFLFNVTQDNDQQGYKAAHYAVHRLIQEQGRTIVDLTETTNADFRRLFEGLVE